MREHVSRGSATSRTTRACASSQTSSRPSACASRSARAPASLSRSSGSRGRGSPCRGEHGLDLFWLEAYGGGLFLPFADATSGAETYGAGRYLLDTVKGADLGSDGERLVLDLNFAYNPSCAYDARWACPLAPPANRLPLPLRAGELAYRSG